MKKIICIWLIFISVLFQLSTAFSNSGENPLNLKDDDCRSLIIGNISRSVRNLQEFDVVREPFEKWNSDDFITRRNAFEIAYIVVCGGFRGIGSDDSTYQLTISTLDDVGYRTYDHYLADSLAWNGLFNGKINEYGKQIADFNGYMTYYEALTVVSRMLIQHYKYRNSINNAINSWDTDYPYYVFAEEIGLINNNSIIDYSSLQIDIEQMNHYITAFQFMHLINKVMYMPHLKESGGSTQAGYRFIDEFINADRIEDNSMNNIIYIP